MSYVCHERNLMYNVVPMELQGRLTVAQWNEIVSAFKDSSSDGNLVACLGEWLVCCTTGIFCIFCCHPFIAPFLSSWRLSTRCKELNTRVFRGQPILSCYDNEIRINYNFLTYGTHNIYTAPPVQAAAAVHIMDESPLAILTNHQYHHDQNNMHTNHHHRHTQDHNHNNNNIKYPHLSENEIYTSDRPPEAIAIASPICSTDSSRIETTAVYIESTAVEANYSQEHEPMLHPSAPPMSSSFSPPSSHHRIMRVAIPPNTYPGSTVAYTSPDGNLIQVVVPLNAFPGQFIDVRY